MPDLRLLTLNTFGLPLFLGWRRLARISRKLDESPFSVLCLQEIQQNAYVPLLLRALSRFQHHAFELNVFAPKGGLFTAARLPLHASRFIGYQNRGRPLSPGFADWALNKGVLVSELTVQGRRVVILNTHLHANYAGNWDPNHAMARIQRDQVRHLVTLVREQPRDALVVVCGDFNFPRGSFLYDELLGEAGLDDPLANDPRPTYRPFPLFPNKYALPIDFVLIRQPKWPGLRLRADIVQIQDADRTFPHQRFLTDHNALTLEASWTTSDGR